MTIGDRNRLQNKHRKVFLKTDRGVFRVLKTTNTLEPKIGATLLASEVQIMMDKGLTVTVTGK